MRSAERFYREVHAEGDAAFGSLCASLPATTDAKQLAAVGDAIAALGDAINMLADHEKQAKARRERIQWVYASERTMVARHKGQTYRYRGADHKVDVDTKWGWREIGAATSIESASRKIRAWRKK